MKISTFAASLMVVGLIIVLYTLFLSDLNASYGEDDYDDSLLTSFDELNELHSIADETRNTSYALQDTSEGLDFTSIVTMGINALKVSLKSFDVFAKFTTTLTRFSPFGRAGEYVASYIVGIVVFLLIVGVFIKVVTRGGDT